MLKKFFIFAALCWSSSADGVILTSEESRDLGALQRCAVSIKKTWDQVASQIQTVYGKRPQQWVSPKAGSPEKIAELCKNAQTPWPTNVYPASFGFEKSPSMLEYGAGMTENYKICFFQQDMPSFMEALRKRKSTGKGLKFENQDQLDKYQREFSTLGSIFAELLTTIDTTIAPLYAKYSNKIDTVYLLLMPLKEKITSSRLKTASFQERFKDDLLRLEYGATEKRYIEPSLKTTTATVEEEFIKDQLFSEAAHAVYATAINSWGNLAWIHAVMYKEIGDESLVSLLPKIRE